MSGVTETHDPPRRKWTSPVALRWFGPAIVLGSLATIVAVMNLDGSGAVFSENEPSLSIAIALLGWAVFPVSLLAELPDLVRNAAILLTTTAYWAVLFAPTQWTGQSRKVRTSLRIAKYVLVLSHIGIAILFLWFMHVWMVEFSATFSPGGEF